MLAEYSKGGEMNIKSLFLGILILGIVIAGPISQYSLEAHISELYNAKSEVLQEAYTYERVLIDGVWWIIVLGEDGSIIDKYIDPVQD